MSLRSSSLKLLVAGLLLAGVGVAWMAAVPERGDVREITLVARGMAYYLPGDPTPNPDLIVAPSEIVRVVLRNDDRGIEHDLVAPSLELAIAPMAGNGASASALLQAPAIPGTYPYLCTLHPVMMRGRIVVGR